MSLYMDNGYTVIIYGKDTAYTLIMPYMDNGRYRNYTWVMIIRYLCMWQADIIVGGQFVQLDNHN